MERAILFFGRLRDVAGAARLDAAPPGHVRDVPALIDWLAARDQELGKALRGPGVRVALDKSFVASDAALGETHEIAFMSPLSGG